MLKKSIFFFLAVAQGAANTAFARNSDETGFDQLMKAAPAAYAAPALPEATMAPKREMSGSRFMTGTGSEYLERPYLTPEGLEMDEAGYGAYKSLTSLYRGSAVGQASFGKELETITGSRFTGGNSAKLLFGPESFAMRDKLMLAAKKSIYITAYSFHDDVTGNQLADLLIAKRRQGVEVKLIADAKVAFFNSRKLLNRMEAGGIEVLRWSEPGRLLDIWHVKMLVIDGRYSLVGGINVGDVYSHRGSGPKWQDYDVLYSGPAVTDTLRFFAREWNARLEAPRKAVSVAKARQGNFEGGSSEISVVFQNPPREKQILGTILKSIYGARTRINIAHSYFIAIPPLKEAIIDARRRGVEVNIITNTSKSIDSEAKQAAVPIIRSLAGVYPYGVNIYLNQGENLHGKFMTVDGTFATIGSYNMHPRSEKYDSEMNVLINSAEAVRQFDATFAGLVANSKKVKSPSDLAIPGGFATFVSNLIERYFFDMLSPK